MFKIFFVLSTLIAAVYCGGDPADTQATVLEYKNEASPDGSYNYKYASSNGIEASESGVGSSYATGGFSYTSPEGQKIQLSYTADENGFQPRGDHLPTPPPIPAYILRALEYIKSHPFKKDPNYKY